MGSMRAPKPVTPSIAMTSKPLETLDLSASEYVLPAPPRVGNEVVVVSTRPQPLVGMRRSGEVARAIGDRVLALAECQQQFFAELRGRLVTLDDAIAEDSRAQLKGAVRDVMQVLEWCEAIQSDLRADGQLAAAGAEPLDLADLCHEVAAHFAPHEAVVVSGQCPGTWWGNARALAEVLHQALLLVAERTGGVGTRLLEVGGQPDHPTIRVVSYGEPVDGIDSAVVRNFRQVAAMLGAKVVPDALGPGGSGLLLLLPSAG